MLQKQVRARSKLISNSSYTSLIFRAKDAKKATSNKGKVIFGSLKMIAFVVSLVMFI